MKINHKSLSVKFINKMNSDVRIGPNSKIDVCTYLRLLLKSISGLLWGIFASFAILFLFTMLALKFSPLLWIFVFLVYWVVLSLWTNAIGLGTLGLKTIMGHIEDAIHEHKEKVFEKEAELMMHPKPVKFSIIKAIYKKFKEKTCVILEVE